MKGMGLAELKDRYFELQKKHGLPIFEEMNQDFYIEKISENETELLIREIRRMVGDRLANYMRFLESLLNPVNVPMFVFSIIKTIGQEEKNRLSEAYKELIKNEIMFLELDLEFNEKKEAGFIKDSFELWQKIKKELAGIFEKAKKNFGGKAEENSRGYFG